MTQLNFIALADHIRLFRHTLYDFSDEHINVLADFCEYQSHDFDRTSWLGYINGTCGPYGEKLKKGG